MTAAGSIVNSNLLWSENQSRPNPAGWVSGRIRLRTRIPYYQLRDINTCLPSLSSQPFINTAVAVRFRLFFFSGSTFTYFWVRQESCLPSPFSSSAFSAPIEDQECQAPCVCQRATKIASKYKILHVCLVAPYLPPGYSSYSCTSFFVGHCSPTWTFKSCDSGLQEKSCMT